MAEFNDRSSDSGQGHELETAEDHCHGHGESHHPPRLVTITIDHKHHEIAPGRHTVAELKAIGHIPACDELSEIRHGKPHPLPENGSTEIKGHEVFLSSPGSCSSS